jgi:hypothetical protein
MTEPLTFWLVRNDAGQWFRRKGYGGGGETWVDDKSKARVFTKLGQARARVTYFANAFPGYPPPSIVELTVTEERELDDSERVGKVLKARDVREEREMRRARDAAIRDAEREYQRAKARWDEARSR